MHACRATTNGTRHACVGSHLRVMCVRWADLITRLSWWRHLYIGVMPVGLSASVGARLCCPFEDWFDWRWLLPRWLVWAWLLLKYGMWFGWHSLVVVEVEQIGVG